MTLKVGAPKGGRVHNFIWCLPEYVSKNYNVSYSYDKNHYFVYRKSELITNFSFGYKDFYIICRTSRNCFKISAYFNFNGESYCGSASSAKAAGEFINMISQVWHDKRAWTCDKLYYKNYVKNAGAHKRKGD